MEFYDLRLSGRAVDVLLIALHKRGMELLELGQKNNDLNRLRLGDEALRIENEIQMQIAEQDNYDYE